MLLPMVGPPRSRARSRLAAALALLALPMGNALADGGVQASAAAAWLQTLEVSDDLDRFVAETLAAERREDTALVSQVARIAVIDIPVEGPPRLGQWKGDSPVYPASVPKFAYLMAAFAWRDQGRLEIDAAFDRELRAMVYASSNRATQKVVARLTETEPGPRLEPAAYREFRDKRLAVKRWLAGLGITDLHLVHPTYDGGGDLYGREVQFLQDPDVAGSLPNQTGAYRNRQAMTAVGTAKLLALLATDRALSQQSSAEVRERMRRDPDKQPYLRHRIAGGASHMPGLEVFAKTGTWGPIHADAGIVRHPSGHQLVIVVFLRGTPLYHGSFIAELTERAVKRVFGPLE